MINGLTWKPFKIWENERSWECRRDSLFTSAVMYDSVGARGWQACIVGDWYRICKNHLIWTRGMLGVWDGARSGACPQQRTC